MSSHEHPPVERERPAVERHCDVAVVGGSAAGLAAALQLVRQRRSVIVVDDGTPRNAPAEHMHSFLGRDGSPPAGLLAAGRTEVRGYGGEILSARVERVTETVEDGFRVEISDGHAIVARRVIAASGLEDVLPEIDGVAEQWGRDVIHCPFCHGYEVRDRRVVHLVTHPMGLHPAALFRQLTERLTVVLHDGIEVDADEVQRLRAAGVDVRPAVARRLVTEGTGPDRHIVAVELADGQRIDADAVAIVPRFRARAAAFTSLGLRPVPHASGLGDVVEVDLTGATSVPGLYAAGNITDSSHQVLQAAAHGSRVGAMVAFSLADEDIRAAARPSGNETDWDHRYSGDQMWSGNPNGTVVAEVEGMPPGRALDVGAGEGGDALWLAEHGWTVTASDISQRALDRVAEQAGRRGLSVARLRADANSLGAFGQGRFDLVSASYASIPRTPDGRGVASMMDAVAPGGTLLVVSHDLRPMREQVEAGHALAFDPDAYVSVDDVASALTDHPDWEVQVHQTRPRPAGAASAHHVEDVVLRARRRDR